MIWRYLASFSIFVPLMYPLRTDPGITSPYFIISVQFTETDCIISVKDLNTKEKLISGGITLKHRSVNFLDVEKTITNVTIKDAPYEVSDCYIATQMMKYGEVIPGSVRRGHIKGTNIENGSRSTSKKLTDLCFSVIPPDITFSFVFKSFTEIIQSVSVNCTKPTLSNSTFFSIPLKISS
jgi:hypothetical protein